MPRPESSPGPSGCGVEHRRARRPRLRRALQLFHSVGVPGAAVRRSRWPSCVSRTSPAPTCCRMFNVYGNIHELLALRWLRSSGVAGTHRGAGPATRTLHAISAGAHGRPVRCFSARLFATKTIFMARRSRRNSSTPFSMPLKFILPRIKLPWGRTHKRPTRRDLRNFSAGDTTWPTFRNVRFRKAGILPGQRLPGSVRRSSGESGLITSQNTLRRSVKNSFPWSIC